MIELADCRLQLVVARAACRRSIVSIVRAAIEGGVDLVQLREKEGSTADRVAVARSLAAVTTDVGVGLLINDDVEAARCLGAAVAGVHVGQNDLPIEEVRRQLGPAAWIGLSTHSDDELARGEATSATHFGLGSCFPTGTKSDASLLPREEIAKACSRSTRPLFAIGGISAANVESLVAMGVRRVAVSTSILSSDDPAAAAAEILDVLAGRA